MLGRYQRGGFASLRFSDAQEKLSQLLIEFGPPSRTANVLDPFWRLQNDSVWRVKDDTGGRIGETIAPPTATVLSDRGASGNFSPEISETLKKQPAYIAQLGRDILAAHFPATLHDDICAAVGLETDAIGGTYETMERRRRDADFRPRIIRAYEHRCAVTGWDLRLINSDVGLEAAHIKWHTAGGPSTETNGIALNALHHKLFDLGAFTLSLDRRPRVLVSRDVHGGDFARTMLMSLHGREIRSPQDPLWLPDPEFIRWHHAEVFKGDSRAF
jgi:putative restriction endonuclease